MPLACAPKSKALNVKWHKSHEAESKADVNMGMAWLLSYLGAQLPKGSLQTTVDWQEETIFAFKPEQAGFDKKPLEAINVILEKIESTEKYERDGYVDIGELTMLLFNSSWHYYEITQMPKTLDEFLSKHSLDGENPLVMNPGESGIAKESRIVFHPVKEEPVLESAYLAIEGHGLFSEGTFDSTEYEVFDFMSNGQPRFGIYNAVGDLIESTSSALSAAGKPAKCMWCHESTIQRSFKKNLIGEGKLKDFNDRIMPLRDKLLYEQLFFDTEIAYDCLSDHRVMEFFYFGIEMPNAERLSSEWKIDVAEVKKMLSELATYESHHMPELGPTYSREELEKIKPNQLMFKPFSQWEENSYEPNFFKQ